MKCPSCGKRISKDATVCQHCNEELVVKEEVETTEEFVMDPNAEIETIEDRETKKKYIIKPEVGKKMLNSFKTAFGYVVKTVARPSSEKEPLTISQILCIDVLIALICSLWLYILQRGLLEHLVSNNLALHNAIKISFSTTILGGFAIAILLVLLCTFIVAITRLFNKGEKSQFKIIQEATHIIIVPSILLLLVTIAGAFWFILGLFGTCIAFVSLFMNVVLLFKDKNNYLSYIIVSVTIALMMLFVAYVLYMCIRSWSIGDLGFSKIFTLF